MKRTYLFLFSGFLLLITLSACHREEESLQPDRPIRINSLVVARSTLEECFAANDEIGIFMLERPHPDTPATLTSATEKWLDNSYFSLGYDGTSWSSLAPVYWKDETTRMDAIAYYPYMDITQEGYDVNRLPFEVHADQTETEQLRQSDFLYAVERDLDPKNPSAGISLSFRHLLCKITVQLRFDEKELKNATALRISAPRVRTGGWIDLNDGKTTVNNAGTPTSVNFHTKLDETEAQAEGIFFPQTIPAGIFLTAALVGDTPKSYDYTLPMPLILEKGKEYIVDFDCTKK